MPKKGRQPATRISSGQVKRMMQSDEEVGRMVAAVPVMVARLTEMFVTRLLATTGSVVADRGAKTLAPEHVAAVIREDDRWVEGFMVDGCVQRTEITCFLHLADWTSYFLSSRMSEIRTKIKPAHQ